MSIEVAAMMAAGLAALIAGPILALPRLAAADGPGKLILLGPIFEAAALAAFSAEHFTDAHDLAPIVPHWLGVPLFWVYFVGCCLFATALSFVAWRYVRSAAAWLAILFLIIVATLDFPGIPKHLHERIFWTLTFRETAFACGALILSASLWPRASAVGPVLARLGRTVLAAIMLFYAVEHFLFPHFVIGVPLEKPTPAWIPAQTLWADLVGVALFLGALGLLYRPTIRLAAAATGLVLLLVTVLFYGPNLIAEFHSNPVEGLNYVYDTLLFTATVLLAGFAAEPSPARTTPHEPVLARETANSLP